jgi:hypothetical protein
MDQILENFETWGIVEIVGHVEIAGYVSEATIAGQGFIRIDVPSMDGSDQKWAYTQFVGPGFIYAITPTDELTARRASLNYQVPTGLRLAKMQDIIREEIRKHR